MFYLGIDQHARQITVSLRDERGDGVQARQILIARRLIERGVRFVQVWHGQGQPWDNHDDIKENHARLAGQCDQAIGGFLGGLDGGQNACNLRIGNHAGQAIRAEKNLVTGLRAHFQQVHFHGGLRTKRTQNDIGPARLFYFLLRQESPFAAVHVLFREPRKCYPVKVFHIIPKMFEYSSDDAVAPAVDLYAKNGPVLRIGIRMTRA